ncbi:MAG: glycoside hydrolase family 38 C-terminal domain-containing protein [Clostridiaceae bacterium]|nr:glycoside hydrolase family 38 C-terminal domain-containing protein [Clostridiaceae bacterium]
MGKIIGFIVNAGHLDIEWYQPLRSYRFWTIKTMEQLIHKAAPRDDYATYVLDGQVFPLEEYLSVVPADRAAAAQLVQSGKLSIGPFYTQFDEWLPSAEAIIRNCLWGNRLSRRFGRCMQAGYLPDNFGHPPQLPQILRNFGLDSLLFMRGMPDIGEDHPDEFLYEGLDGSQVVASHFRESYGGAFDLFSEPADPIQPCDIPYYPGYLSFDYHLELSEQNNTEHIARSLAANARRIQNRYPSGVIPLIAGFDHMPPQIHIGEAIRIANDIQQDITFLMGSAEDYIRLLQSRMDKPLIIKQELTGSVYQQILLGALSTRTYLKRQHFAAEILLEKYVEPLLAWAQYQHFQTKPALLQEAWRMILINSAHDSIHGSSVDEVHLEMEARYAAVRQIAAGQIHEILAFAGDLVPSRQPAGERGVMAYAPVGSPAPQTLELWLPVGGAAVCMTDSAGDPLPTQILERETCETNGLGQERNDLVPDALYRKILFQDYLASQEIKAYTWKPASPAGETVTLQNNDSAGRPAPVLDNGILRVEFHGALAELLDYRTGKRYPALNLLEEEADAGDAWDFSPPWIPGEVVRSTRFAFQCRLAEQGPVRQSVCLTGCLNVPLRLNGDERSAGRVDLPVTLTVSLLADTPRLDVRLQLDNQARDHRIRLRVPMGIKSDEIISQGQLAIIRRPVETPREKRAWRQPPTRLLPFREWLSVCDGRLGLAIAVKGLYDYEAIPNPLTGEPEICLTLLRGFAKMGRMNMMQRSDRASAGFDTPGAQCPGLQEIEWSYLPYSADPGDIAPFLPFADSFLCPPAVHAIRPKRSAALAMDLPDNRPTLEPAAWHNLFAWPDNHIRLSCFKKAYDDDSFILRFYENQGKRGRLVLDAKSFARVWQTDMNEQDIRPVPLENGQIKLDIAPYQAITLRLAAALPNEDAGV